MTKKLAYLVVNYRKFIMWAAIFVTFIASYFAVTGLTLRVSLTEMLPKNHENVKVFKEFNDKFGGVNGLIVQVKTSGENVYNYEFLESYRKISDELFFHDSNLRPLYQAVNLRKTRAVSGGQGQIVVDPLMWPVVPQTEAEMNKFRVLIRSQFSGSLVSSDEKSLLIAAELADDVDTGKFIDFIDDLRLKYEADNVTLSIVGRPVLLGTVKKQLPGMITIFLLSVLVIAILLFMYFRTIVGVLVPMVVALTVTIWGFGVIGFVQYNLDPLLLLLPFFVFATVLSHSVQFVSRVLDELDTGLDMKDAVQKGLERFLFPSTAAVITDAAGFLVLALVTIPSIQSLALICTSWLLSLTPGLIVGAAFMSSLKRPKRYTTTLPFQKSLAKIFGEKPATYFFLPIFCLLLGGGYFVSQGLKIGDAVGSPILWPDSKYNQDVSSINDSFNRVGTDVMQVYFSGDGEIMLDPNVYHQTEALDRYIYERVESATPANSLVPIIKNINMVLWEGDLSYQLLPDTEDEIGFNVYMFRSGGEPGDFAAYTNPQWSIGKVSLFTSEHSAETVNALTDTIQEFSETYVYQENEPKVIYTGGQIGLIKATNDEIEVKEHQLLIAIIIIILINLFWLYRSLVLAFTIIFVLATSHFITMSLMTLMDVGMNLNTLPLAALGLGRGVDYSIYMADRIREEMHGGLDFSQAARKSFNTTGVAVIVTALTMILPLLPWYFLSPIRFQAEMGVLLAIILAFNMVGAITVVPAAIKLLKPKGFNFQPSAVS